MAGGENPFAQQIETVSNPNRSETDIYQRHKDEKDENVDEGNAGRDCGTKDENRYDCQDIDKSKKELQRPRKVPKTTKAQDILLDGIHISAPSTLDGIPEIAIPLSKEITFLGRLWLMGQVIPPLNKISVEVNARQKTAI